MPSISEMQIDHSVMLPPMDADDPEVVTVEAPLLRLREILWELQDGTRVGRDLLFGQELSPPGDPDGRWLLFHREVDDRTTGPRSACVGTSPMRLPREAAIDFLSIGIEMIGQEPLFVRMNLQFRPHPDASGDYLGFVETKFGMDWQIVGEQIVTGRWTSDSQE